MAKEEEKSLFIKDALKEFVLEQWAYSKRELQTRHDAMRRYHKQYRGQRDPRKEFWQANYVIPSLKEALRIKIPLFMNILFAKGYESFDVEPGSKEDESKMFYTKNLLTYGLRGIGKRRGGLYGQMEDFMKQREMYGYTLGRVYWKDEKDKQGKTTFHGPEFETLDVFSTFPDPGSVNINDSWVVLQYRDVFIGKLRMLENEGIYENIGDLYNTSQPQNDNPDDNDSPEQGSTKNRVELLEYHGEVPKSLLEGDLYDVSQVNPYEDEYVDAIITLANRDVIIRRDENPYETTRQFVEASKDRLPNEMLGVGTAEDIEAMAQELTNAHNKLTDCINLIANPMAVVNLSQMVGMKGTIISHPGKMFKTQPGVENVAHAMYWMDTSSQAAALGPLIKLIGMLKDEIQRNTQAVPVISPVVDKAGLPETLGATQMIQANASEPIKHDVKHSFEPAFESILEIMLELYLKFLESAPAYQILGREKAEEWEKEKHRADITKEDIQLTEPPTFIARGVSVFSEKQAEIEKMLRFLEISTKATVPALDQNTGEPLMGEDGNPVMVPKADVGEIMKRIAELSGFKNLEDLLPYLRQKRLQLQEMNPQGSNPSTQNTPGGPLSPGGAPRGRPPTDMSNPLERVSSQGTMQSGRPSATQNLGAR
jgi:hypothetical protein